MNYTLRIVLIVLGALIGFVVGGVLGCSLPLLALPLISEATGAELFVLGWMVFATIPGGAILGAVLGGFGIIKRPWIFTSVVTIVVLAHGTHHVLRECIHTPRSYVLKLDGIPGEKFVGAIRVDGDFMHLKGTLPAEFAYRALEVELAIALLDAKEGENISVDLLIDGQSSWDGRGQGHLVVRNYKSFGYSEWIGGTSSGGKPCAEVLDRVRESLPAKKLPER